MEGPAPRSSSHSRAAPPHSSSASAAAAFFKKVDTNGVTAGGNAFMAHDDVYGGPPKYAVTPFAPSGEQYSEIFGSFRSGKACSIPNLDLPPFDDSAAAFDFIGFSGFVYSEIFGGFDFADFALSCDKLFRRSGGSEESSDDAWTEAGSLSEESDPSACSGKTQYQTTDSMLNGSYNKFNMLTTEDSIVIHVAQPSTAPGSGSMYERSSLQKEVEERYDSGLADGIILHKHSSEISVKTHSKTASILSSVSDLKNSEKMYEDSAIDEEPKMDKGALHAELKSTEQDIYGPRHLNVESECSTSPIGPYTLNGTNNIVPETTCECEDLNSSNLVLRLDEKNKKPTAMAIEFDKMLKDHAAEVMLVDVEFRSAILLGEMESNMPQMEHICMSTKHLQNTATQCMMTGRESDCQNQSLSLNINRRVGMEVINVNGNLALDDVENVGNVRKREEFERETRKLQEERKQEWEEKLKLQIKRLEELRAGERDKELDKVCLRKHEQERGGGRENKLEKEFRLWKLDKDWEREREREKDKMGVELNTAAGNERASTETHEMAGRAATERATAEARQKAMAEARERLEKACAEARDKSLSEKASTESWLRAERAAVARATAEARERAFEKAMAERDTFEARELVARSASETFSSPLRDIGLRHTSSYSDLWKSDKTNEVEGETQRGRARLERHCRTVERVAKALAEKNTRDLVAQREQAERNRLAQFLDADIKKWSDGKEGNLHALLSTLQYILGPDSGWHPIPLTELTASASVKKAYRKATLCVHPDKLQQRGATIQQKYICEKVFDLLKDSWSRFNSEER